MKFRHIYLGILLSSAPLVIGATEPTAVKFYNEAGVPLSGTVTSDGKPLAGALVSIPDLKRSVMTDADGKYSLSDIPPGIYLVTVTKEGYASFSQKVNIAKANRLDADMKTSYMEVEQIVLTGVSKATSVSKSPVPMQVVNRAYIQEHAAATNVIDEIANIPGVSAVTTGPNISKPFIHGLGYNRVVTAVDGIRQEGQQWGDEHGVEVDQNAIDRVEVIKGPASLSFGSDAIGGVVNLITVAPAPEGKILGSVSTLYGTNNGQNNSSLNLRGNSGGFVWGVVGSYKLAKDYQNPHDGRVYGTNFKESDLNLMLGVNKSWGYSSFHASAFRDLQAIPDGSRDPETRKFTYQTTEEDSYRPIVPDAVLNSYKIPALHQDVQSYRIYNNTSVHLGEGDLLLNLGYQYSYRREFTHPENTDIPGLNLHLSSYTYDAKYNFVFGKDYDVTVGINGMYQNNKMGATSTDFPIPNYRQFDFGPFFVVKRSFEKLDLSGGIRFDTRTFVSDDAYVDSSGNLPVLYTGALPTGNPSVSQHFTALNKTFSGPSGSFGGTYNFSNRFLLKANIATGFRAPSVAELSANGADPGSQIYHVGDENFKPEYSVQGDVGLALSMKKFSINLDVFSNTIRNYIFQQQMLDAGGNPIRVDSDGTVNAAGSFTKFTYVQDKARISGAEINLDFHPVSWLHFENSMALTYGKNLDAGDNPDLKYLPFMPPLHTHSELRANFSKNYGTFKPGYVFASFDHYDPQKKFFSAYGTETYTAGYNLVGAGFGGSFMNKGGRKVVELYLEGTNLFNVGYQSNMSRLKYFDNPDVPAGVQPGIFNMGRNVTLKVVLPLDFNTKN